MNLKEIFPFFIVLILIGGAFLLFDKRSDPSGESLQESSSQSDSQLDTQTKTQGEVTISVTPVDVGSKSPEWIFNITMDTHSVELDHDLDKIVFLADEMGRTYPPISWQGSDKGGHHRNNTLIFNAVFPRPEVVEMKVVGVGGEETLTYSWKLN